MSKARTRDERNKGKFFIPPFSSFSLPFSDCFKHSRYNTFFTTWYTNRSQCHPSHPRKGNFDRPNNHPSFLPSFLPCFERQKFTKGQQGGSPLFAFTDPETRFSLPLLFPFLSLSLSLFLSSPIAYTHEPVLAEASLVKVTTSSGGESESRFRDKRWPPIKLYQRGGPILMAVTADTRPSVYSRGLETQIMRSY